MVGLSLPRTDVRGAAIMHIPRPQILRIDDEWTVRYHYRDVVRNLPAGHSELDAAIEAGHASTRVRFLLSRSSRDGLRQTLAAGGERHRLLV